MELQANTTLGFEVGGLYSRRLDVNARFGGQQQGGISTPKNCPYIFAFTGEVGAAHGYFDHWETDDQFIYYGEGQSGDMTFTGGNRAIRDHVIEGKRLFLFRMLGKGRPYRFLGEFVLIRPEVTSGASSKPGETRQVIKFVLAPVLADMPLPKLLKDVFPNAPAPPPATKTAVVQVRTQQSLFRRRVADVEKGCRLTAVCDLRFLRASHVKPWSKCNNDAERTDRYNGLLLCPQGDLLFDRGWISFDEGGKLLRSPELPNEVASRLGLDLRPGRKCGQFLAEQQGYLQFHRDSVFRKRYAELKDPLGEILLTIG